MCCGTCTSNIPTNTGTVPCKCKLTVSTRNSILEAIENRLLRFEARVSSIETLEEFFEDLVRRFRGNDSVMFHARTRPKPAGVVQNTLLE